MTEKQFEDITLLLNEILSELKHKRNRFRIKKN